MQFRIYAEQTALLDRFLEMSHSECIDFEIAEGLVVLFLMAQDTSTFTAIHLFEGFVEILDENEFSPDINKSVPQIKYEGEWEPMDLKKASPTAIPYIKFYKDGMVSVLVKKAKSTLQLFYTFKHAVKSTVTLNLTPSTGSI